MQAWIYHAKDLGIISEAMATHLFRRFRSRGWHVKEPGKQLPAETPERIERLVMRAVAENTISQTRAAELLGKSLRQFYQEVSAQNDGFTADLCN